MKIKKGDKVLVISGKSRGKTGKVLQVFSDNNRITVEGLNLGKKHVRPRREGEKGQIVELALPMHVSNVKLLCPKCNQPARVGFRVGAIKEGAKNSRIKTRICKKCGSEV